MDIIKARQVQINRTFFLSFILEIKLKGKNAFLNYENPREQGLPLHGILQIKRRERLLRIA